MKQYIIGIGCFLLISCCSVSASDLYPFDNPKQSAQFEHLLRDLRCLVCQNQDLVDSNAELAADLRHEVYILVQEGRSDEDVIHYLTARYGDFILFNPPVKSITYLLWGAPPLFLLIGLLIFKRATCHRALLIRHLRSREGDTHE
jgi:cytochrome c-type biogenesis protein CcmH